MNPIEQFKQEVETNLKKQGEDAAIKTSSNQFLSAGYGSYAGNYMGSKTRFNY
jgi:hypothetical protein